MRQVRQSDGPVSLSLALLTLVAGAVLNVVKLHKGLAYIVGSVFILTALGLIAADMTAPLLILGACAMVGLPSVPYMFARARELDGGTS